uniref:Uncharacterized protein n=1 Tax=Steinernema glaseri TaxID=37863 RepID=A0A1I7ZSC7_9BILA
MAVLSFATAVKHPNLTEHRSLLRALKIEWPAAAGSRVSTPRRLPRASSTHLDAGHDEAANMEHLGNLRIAAPISTNSSRRDRPEMKSALANVCLLYFVSVVHLWRSASRNG